MPGRLIQHGYLVVEDGFNLELGPSSLAEYRRGRGSRDGQEKPMIPGRAFRQLYPYGHRAHRNEFLDRCPPGSSTGQVYQVQHEAILLTIEMAVNESRALNHKREAVLGRPAHKVCKQVTMIGNIAMFIAPVDVGRQVRNPGSVLLPEIGRAS